MTAAELNARLDSYLAVRSALGLPDLLRNRFVATSDGKRFLMNVLLEQNERAGFTVVLNWPAELKR